MPTQIQWRRGNTAQTSVFTGVVGEITVDTDKKTLVVHDGVTPGGTPLAIEAAQQDAFSYAHANSAYLSQNTTGVYANSAYTHANAAYVAANTKFSSSGGTISGDVLISGNITPTTDNDKYLGSELYRWHSLYVGPGSVNIGGISLSNVNNQLTISGASTISVSGSQDTSAISNHANAAFAVANTALLSTGAFAQANAAYTHANNSYAQANTGTILAQAAFDSANNVSPQIQPAFNAANAAYIQANTATTNAATADQKAVSAGSYANSAYNQANTATTNAATADQKAVSAGSYANSAYAHANTKFASAGGTITGSVTISGGDLTVSGNLTISGNTTTVSANNLVVNDSLIYLANNATGNTSDIGIVGHFTQGSYQHTGLVRDATDGKWKFFSNVATEPTGTTLDFTGAYWDTVKVGIIEADTANVGNFNLVTYIGGAYAHANSAYASANNVAPQIQPAFNHANAAYVQANTATVNAAAASSYANSAYAKANTSLQNNADTSTSGTLYAAAVVSNSSVQVNSNAGAEGGLLLTGGFVPFNIARQTVGNYTTSSTSQVTVDTFVAGSGGYRSAKYLIQMTSGASYHMLELSVIHDGTTVYISQYGEVMSGSSLGTFDATIASFTLSLKFTPTNSVTKVDFIRTALAV